MSLPTRPGSPAHRPPTPAADPLNHVGDPPADPLPADSLNHVGADPLNHVGDPPADSLNHVAADPLNHVGDPPADPLTHVAADPLNHVADPLTHVRALGERTTRIRSTLGTAVAVALHLAAFAFTLTAREPLHLIDTTVALDIIADEPTKPSAPAPAAAPEPAPELVKAPPPPAPIAAPKPPEDDEDPYEEDDSPPPAQAAQIITAPSEPAAPEPDDTFASGTSTAPAFGLVAGDGTGNGATFDPRARTGAAPKAKPAPIAPTEPISYRAPDLSRPATYMGMTSDCDFPSEAPAGMDTATVQVAVTVDASGKPLHAEVVRDLGYGFGRAARACALRQMYRAGRDASGRPALTKTPPIRVKFIR